MIAERTIYHYALLELEAVTPHGVQAGFGDTTHDVLLTRDANGLPCIPATSFVGVLRHLYSSLYGSEAENSLFGYAQGNSGQPSWVHFTTGMIHDSGNRPVEGLKQQLDSDPVLNLLLQDKPLVRQRVKLTEKGTAVETGKFDQTLVPAGARYSCFIGFWSNGSAANEEAFNQLLALLSSKHFRLGHGTRAGSGAFKVNRLQAARWDLTTKDGQIGFCQRSRSRASALGLTDYPLTALDDGTVTASVSLMAEAGWRIGGGDHPFSEVNSGRDADLLPQGEKRIIWNENKAVLGEHTPLLPASAIKGALAHRFAFHYRCLKGDFIDPTATETTLEGNNQNPGVQALFGYVAGQKNHAEETAATGQLVINDLYLGKQQISRQMHNKVDRFTGGVVSGALFEEENFWKTRFTLKLTLLAPDLLESDVRQALHLTLQDLAQGWLPLGASSSRGHGIFIGESIQWSDQGAWLQNQVEVSA